MGEKLKPCPFCGDPMEDRGYGAIHVNGKGCPIGDLAIADAEKWNRRASHKMTDAEQFDRADWYWRTMDPDDSGDTPEEAINRSMLGPYVVCEIASSFTGPTRYGFVADVLDSESDDTEFLHFASQEEAVEAAKSRAALSRHGEGK